MISKTQKYQLPSPGIISSVADETRVGPSVPSGIPSGVARTSVLSDNMAAPGPSPTTAACPAPRWSDTTYPLVTLVRVVLRLPGEVQARADQQDTIGILMLNLAASDADSTLNILNIAL